MIRYSLCATISVAAALFPFSSAASTEEACLDDSRISEFLTNNAVGVYAATFSPWKGIDHIFVFELKGNKMLVLEFGEQCIHGAEIMMKEEYLSSTNESEDECDC